MRWETRGEPPVIAIATLIAAFGRVLDLHVILRADPPEAWHSHPAHAIRVILWGGYTEERLCGRLKRWRPGMIGRVSPHYVHRIHSLHGKVSYSLWLRGPIVTTTRLIGRGWSKE